MVDLADSKEECLDRSGLMDIFEHLQESKPVHLLHVQPVFDPPEKGASLKKAYCFLPIIRTYTFYRSSIS